jgi:hypothetical protein
MDYRPFIAKSIMDVATDRKEGVWCYISHELKKRRTKRKAAWPCLTHQLAVATTAQKRSKVEKILGSKGNLKN